MFQDLRHATCILAVRMTQPVLGASLHSGVGPAAQSGPERGPAEEQQQSQQ